MEIGELDNRELKALDYILNYQPDTRIKYTLEEEIIESLVERGIVEKTRKKDNYSNYYDVLEVGGDYRGQVREAVEENFDSLYPDFGKDVVDEVFQNRVGPMFAFVSKARSGDGGVVRSTHQIPSALFNELEEAGFGFKREYLTTTDNINTQFVFRTHPFNGRDRLLEYADSTITSHLEGLNQVEKWAIYVKEAVGKHNLSSNPADFSPDKLDALKDKPTVEEADDEVLNFIQEDIKDYLRTKIYAFLEKDSFYLTVLEYLKLRSSTEGHIEASFIDEIGAEKRASVENSLPQLLQEGVLLKNGEGEYILTEQVKEIMETIEKRTVVVSYPIRSEEEGQEILYEILEGAEEEIKIIDRFFDREALKLIKTVVPKKEGLNIHILTSVNDERKKDLADEYEELIDNSRFDVKEIEENAPHDRFIIVDGEKIWQLGNSINGLGKKFSTIFLHSDEESDHYIELFDSLWEESTDLQETIE